MYAAGIFARSRPRQLFAALALLLALLVACSFYIIAREEARALNEAARRALAERMTINMDKCARIRVKMTYAGADIQGELYPQLKPLLYAVDELNSASLNAFGVDGAPISAALMKKLRDTCGALENCYASGRPAAQYELALRQYLEQFDDILNARFTSDGDFLTAAR